MKNAIILHGRPKREAYYDPMRPSQSNSHWLPWLQRQLLLKDILTQTPELPHPYAATWRDHCREFERYDVTPETILVGHSFGGGFLVRWLSEHKDIRAGTVVLVAPFIDVEKEHETNFFDFIIDENLASRTKKLVILASSNDKPEIQSSVGVLRKKLKGVKYVELKNRGHFTTTEELNYDKFPELLKECLK
jgi:predicted alpha/beta hydrolase family esterase